MSERIIESTQVSRRSYIITFIVLESLTDASALRFMTFCGSLIVNVDRSQTYILAAPTLGDVTGTGTVEIEDALQILRSVVGLSNVIDDNDIALMAANITNRGKKVDAPEVADALQILRSIVGLPTAEKLR